MRLFPIKKLFFTFLSNKNYNSILFLFSGIVLGLSLFHPKLWFLSILSLFFLLHLLFSNQNQKLTRFLLPLSLFSFSFLGTAIIWFWWVLPLEWLGFSNIFFAIGLVFFYWSTTAFVLAFFVFLSIILFIKLRRGTWFDILLFALLWVFFEYARTWGFALFTFGGGSLFGPHFSVGFIGYTLAGHGLFLQLASNGGIYVLSFIVVGLAGILYWLSQVNLFSKSKIIAPVLFFIFIYGLSFIPTSLFADKSVGTLERDTTFALVSTHFEASYERSNQEEEYRFETLKNIINEINKSEKNPHIIVLPEDSRFLSGIRESTENGGTSLNPLFSEENPALIIDSGRTSVFSERDRGKISFYNTGDGSTTSSWKTFLVPQGEYIPSLHTFLLKIFGFGVVVSDFNEKRAYSRADEGTIGVYEGIKIGALFCSEILSPNLYKDLVEKQDADILINIASQSLFHNSQILYHQIQSIAKVHAVSNRKHFLQASNATPSFVVDPYGNIVVESERKEASVLYFSISGK